LLERSLSQKVGRGVVWVTAKIVVTGVLGLITAIILARLLLPSDFGLMAIAMAIITFIQGTTDTGFTSALIQKQDKPEEFLNTVWTAELIRSTILAMVLVFLSPLLSTFFADPRVTKILRVLALSIVIQGFRNVGVVFFRKNLQFNKTFIVEVGPLMANTVVVIPFAFVLRSVWALVWATLATSLVTCIVSYIMHPYRPRLEFNLSKCQELFGFGKWIFGQSIINMFLNQVLTMFIGKFHGIASLGFYNRALAFSSTILQQVCSIVWQIAYPLYSQLQSEPERLKRAYLSSAYLLYFGGLPLAGGLFILSEDFVHLFLTDKWLPIVPLMQILSMCTAIEIINTPSTILFQAIGSPGIGTKITALSVILMSLMIYPLSFWWGLSGTITALLLSNLMVVPIILFFSHKVSNISWWEFVKPILILTNNTGLMIISIYLIKTFTFVTSETSKLICLIIFGASIYLITCLVSDKLFSLGMYKMIKGKFDELIKSQNYPNKAL
jgi:lipopolysaccharide exporter